MRRLNFVPLVIVSWMMVIYLLVTHNLSWYLWIFLAIPIIERAFLGFILWIESQLLRAAAKEMIHRQQTMQDNNPFQMP